LMPQLRPHALAALLVSIAVPAAAGDAAAGPADWPGWRGPSRDGRLAGFAAPEVWPAGLKRAWRGGGGGGPSSRVVAGGRVFVHVRRGDDETVLALDGATGAELWKDSYPAPYRPRPEAEAHGKWPRATPALGEGVLVTLGVAGALSAYEPATGK